MKYLKINQLMQKFLYKINGVFNTAITKVFPVKGYEHPNQLLNMSEAHLRKGSVEPSKVDGLLRLYSMKFCPYAERVRLVLKAKDIKHDTVNINLIDKPEWYFKVHPEGKVPALDTGSKIIVESLNISDYLDETYPQKPLYPLDPSAREKDKELIQKGGKITDLLNNCVLKLDNTERTPAQWLEELRPHLELLENELKNRGTFFFGDSPGMVDYMLWPWVERAPMLAYVLPSKLPLKEEEFPLLRKWKKEMRKDPTVDAIYTNPDRLWKYAQCKLTGAMPDYDNV